MIRITSQKNGFRRCGVAHSKEPTEYQDDKFSKKELLLLKEEKKLVVEVVEDKPTKPPKPSAEELVERLAKAESLEALEALLPKGEKRKTVKDAYDKRKAELEEK